MAYVTLADVQTYLGKSSLTVEETNKINMLILQTKSMLDGYIGDLTETDRDFQVDYEFTYYKAGIIEIELDTNNVAVFNSIEGVPYTDGYKVIGRRTNRIQLKELSKYLSQATTDDRYTTFKVNVKSGYATIPDDVKLCQLTLISNLMQTSSGAVKSETTGPHKIEYALLADPYEIPSSIKTILGKYKSIFY